MRDFHDLIVIGSAFGGSLVAMIARRLGRRVLLVERGRHPRFAIGESSTPVANLVLEELAHRYDLPRLLPFAKWGAWQRTYPEVGCGLKRGFSFYHHRSGEPWRRRSDRANELLVAASPSDEISDTHWYRPDFDHWFQREAVAMGADYVDETSLEQCEVGADGVRLRGVRHGAPVAFGARWVVDASGPRGFLSRALGLPESAWTEFPATQALFSHFRKVRRWESVTDVGESPPYPPDDAALHHVLEDGWIWVLPFQNGITSAGISASPAGAARYGLAEGAAAWRRLLDAYPSLKAQFEGAEPVREFTHMARMPYRCEVAAGPRWALLPSAAGFVDPLMSTGFALTLLGIERLAALMSGGPEPDPGGLAKYAEATHADLDATALLMGALHRNLGRPAAFQSLSMLYFAAAIYSETARRLGRRDLAPGFLLRGRPDYWDAVRAAVRCSLDPSAPKAVLHAAVADALRPVNLAGLGNPSRRNWYPVDLSELFAAASKVEATDEDLRRMLLRCGMEPTETLPGRGACLK